MWPILKDVMHWYKICMKLCKLCKWGGKRLAAILWDFWQIAGIQIGATTGDFFSQKSSGTIMLSLYRQHLRTQVHSSVKILTPSNFLFVFIIFLGRARQWVGVESIMFSDGFLAARLSRVIISIWTFHFILTNGLRHSVLGMQGKRSPFWNLIKESRIVFDNGTPSEFSVHWEALLLIFSVDVYFLHLVKCRAANWQCSSRWSVWVLRCNCN